MKFQILSIVYFTLVGALIFLQTTGNYLAQLPETPLMVVVGVMSGIAGLCAFLKDRKKRAKSTWQAKSVDCLVSIVVSCFVGGTTAFALYPKMVVSWGWVNEWIATVTIAAFSHVLVISLWENSLKAKWDKIIEAVKS